MRVATESRSSAQSAGTGQQGRVLILMNPGRMSRHWMEGVRAAAQRLGLGHVVARTDQLLAAKDADPASLASQLSTICRTQRIEAVIGYVSNSIHSLPMIRDRDNRLSSFFASRGIRELLLWSDHPQWSVNGIALEPEDQSLFRNPLCCHFLKSEAAALELKTLLGWPNCHGLPVAEDAEALQPARGVTPDLDVVMISGSPPRLDERILRLIDDDEPDRDLITGIIADDVRPRLGRIWSRHAPARMVDQLSGLGEAWIDLRRAEERTASIRLLMTLRDAHPDAASWLLGQPAVYFAAVRVLWSFGDWQRAFVPAYLARRFNVGVFGSDWSSLGIPESAEWVDNARQPAVYARGKLALSISGGHDEEGLTHKPFQIAACGVPMVHIDRVGLAECFTPGREVASFATPAEAREVVSDLLTDPDRRESMAAAARARLLKEHTWETRLPEMLNRARWPGA